MEKWWEVLIIPALSRRFVAEPVCPVAPRTTDRLLAEVALVVLQRERFSVSLTFASLSHRLSIAFLIAYALHGPPANPVLAVGELDADVAKLASPSGMTTSQKIISLYKATFLSCVLKPASSWITACPVHASFPTDGLKKKDCVSNKLPIGFFTVYNIRLSQ